MKPKVIYATAGQTIEIRVCHPDSTLDRKGWEELSRPGAIVIRVDGSKSISVSDPSLSIAYRPSSEIRAYYQRIPAE